MDRVGSGGDGGGAIAAAVVALRQRRHAGRAEELERVHGEALDTVCRLETRSRVACDLADGGWFEYQPITGRFVASERAWDLLQATPSFRSVGCVMVGSTLGGRCWSPRSRCVVSTTPT